MTAAIIQWTVDSSFSVIPSTAIQSGGEAVGETVTALYRKKPYKGVLIELGDDKQQLQKAAKELAAQSRKASTSGGVQAKQTKRSRKDIGEGETLVAAEKRRKKADNQKKKDSNRATTLTLEEEIANARQVVDEEIANARQVVDDVEVDEESCESTPPPLPPPRPWRFPPTVYQPLPSQQPPALQPHYPSHPPLQQHVALQPHQGQLQQHTPTYMHQAHMHNYNSQEHFTTTNEMEKIAEKIVELEKRVAILETGRGSAIQGADRYQLGDGLSITQGQHSTLRCISKTHTWMYTARKLLMMLYEDEYLQLRCAMGRTGSSHIAMVQEEMGIMKGFIVELYPLEKVCSETFNAVVNSTCCCARRRKK